MGPRHDRVKPAVRCGEIRCHEVVVVQIFAGVVAHGAFAVNVKVGRRKKPGIMGGGADKSVHLGWTQSERIINVPVAMGFVPQGAGVLSALREQFVRSYGRTVGVYLAIAGRRKRRIATGYGWRRSVERRNARRRIELRQAIEGLIGIAVLRPVLAQFPEVLIEGTVLLGQNDDVMEAAEAGCGGGLLLRHRRLRQSSCRQHCSDPDDEERLAIPHYCHDIKTLYYCTKEERMVAFLGCSSWWRGCPQEMMALPYGQSSLLPLAEAENSGAPQVLRASREPNRIMASKLERPSRTK